MSKIAALLLAMAVSMAVTSCSKNILGVDETRPRWTLNDISASAVEVTLNPDRTFKVMNLSPFPVYITGYTIAEVSETAIGISKEFRLISSASGGIPYGGDDQIGYISSYIQGNTVSFFMGDSTRYYQLINGGSWRYFIIKGVIVGSPLVDTVVYSVRLEFTAYESDIGTDVDGNGSATGQIRWVVKE